MIGASFKDSYDLQFNMASFFPSAGHRTTEWYSNLLVGSRGESVNNLLLWMVNSIVIAIIQVGLTLMVDLLGAYSFVYLKFKGRQTLYAMIIFSLAIPGVIGTASTYSIYASISNLADNLSSNIAYNFAWLILPSIANVSNLFLMKTFFDSVPRDLVESAKMDGASDFLIFRKVVMPLAKSTILLCGLFAFAGSWNNYMWPKIILTGKPASQYTITLGLERATSTGTTWEQKGSAMASSVFAMLPIFIVYLFAQNKMIDGIASTGIKQ
jgi:multiple sugar transport system permease protein